MNRFWCNWKIENTIFTLLWIVFEFRIQFYVHLYGKFQRSRTLKEFKKSTRKSNSIFNVTMTCKIQMNLFRIFYTNFCVILYEIFKNNIFHQQWKIPRSSNKTIVNKSPEIEPNSNFQCKGPVFKIQMYQFWMLLLLITKCDCDVMQAEVKNYVR